MAWLTTRTLPALAGDAVLIPERYAPARTLPWSGTPLGDLAAASGRLINACRNLCACPDSDLISTAPDRPSGNDKVACPRCGARPRRACFPLLDAGRKGPCIHIPC